MELQVFSLIPSTSKIVFKPVLCHSIFVLEKEGETFMVHLSQKKDTSTIPGNVSTNTKHPYHEARYTEQHPLLSWSRQTRDRVLKMKDERDMPKFLHFGQGNLSFLQLFLQDPEKKTFQPKVRRNALCYTN